MFFHNISPVLLEIGPFQIRYYGLFWAIGFIIAYFLIPYIAKRKGFGIAKDDVSDFCHVNARKEIHRNIPEPLG